MVQSIRTINIKSIATGVHASLLCNLWNLNPKRGIGTCSVHIITQQAHRMGKPETIAEFLRKIIINCGRVQKIADLKPPTALRVHGQSGGCLELPRVNTRIVWHTARHAQIKDLRCMK